MSLAVSEEWRDTASLLINTLHVHIIMNTIFAGSYQDFHAESTSYYYTRNPLSNRTAKPERMHVTSPILICVDGDHALPKVGSKVFMRNKVC